MADILPVEEYRKRLLEMRDEIVSLSEASKGSRDTVKLDQQSVGRLSRLDSLQQQSMAKATEARRQQELARIDAALKRIGEGEYGACVTCGEDIPRPRLDLDPATPTCTQCAGARKK